MLKTALLLDGSEAMNSSADYLPTRLLALRPQLGKFVHTYLGANPLASLGVVTMRDGVAHRLNSCTTNTSDILQTLEVKYFLFGGSGAMSLENGLRLALSELVDLKRIAKRVRQTESNDIGREAREEPAARLRILLVSSSVTIVDPHDVFNVIKMLAKLRVRVDVISFCGAVHVFEAAATATGGTLYTPMNYDHLSEVLGRLSTPDKSRSCHEEKPMMIPVGFPCYAEREEPQEAGSGGVTKYLACPQCGLIQTSIPSTCLLCKLLLCSAPLLHTTFVAHNELCAASSKAGGASEGPSKLMDDTFGERCSLCQLGMQDEDGKTLVWQCNSCRCMRCASCEKFVREGIGLCPICIAAPL
ncbi:DNA repair and transcription factor protein, TFIIH complex, SSL1 subunit [Trypanosoma rangeli]|uniref:DNA repair and transcription factor protein, TFIIH complex, SSL1 subunit n=1 Tax=Trypanosoma rangeli TaxID=5698 RepID=A0A422MXM9_TRYRA|nr:DNA repair and transcription factor protein, TFIIH complex, SSL1 subunit [Trypanosoma rangeli]RNE98004.1 DNA repair and transcription factor protein, TFIIH complex, SSL1 subunit [Trypanosoma rangeli]|eukprot:RNE98004.1 DNA repair and transcription factor protein, TFIIH complex, SSL1 subunit [Trypanosoma rangeli]